MPVSPILSTVQYGSYISPWKVAIVLIVVLIWAKLLTWADKDAVDAHLPRINLNAGNLVGLVIGFAAFILLPNFVLALLVMLVIAAAEAAVYLSLRNKQVGLGDLKRDFNNWIKSLGRKEKDIKIAAGQVTLIDRKGSTLPPPAPDSPELGAYNTVQDLLTDPLRRNAERIELRPSDGAASVKYMVDGVPVDGRSVSRENATAAVTMLKTLAGLDIAEKRRPQTGSMKAAIESKKRELVVQTAGSTAGETVLVDVEPKKRHELKLGQIGMSDDQLAIVETAITEATGGIVLLAAPKGYGLTTLMYAILRRHDAFLSHIQTIEREPQVDLEGITQNKIELTPGAELKQVNWIVSQEPDVLLLDKVEDQKSAAELIKFANAGKRVYIGMRATSTFDALKQWRAVVGDDKLAAKALSLVIAGRLVRKLCPACKVDYTPDPETLRKLNVSADKVGKLFNARTQPLRDPKGNPLVCEYCLDMRFKGRVGVFEVFIIDDEVRQQLEAGAGESQLKMVFKKQRQKYLIDHAMGRALEGETSLQEVIRVMRAGGPEKGGSSRGKKE